jgi:NADH-quinone oxidoreductase subunit M
VVLENGAGVARNTAIWIFAGMFIGFAVKVPMFPFHTWLPDAHTEAPTQASVILAAILLEARHVRLRADRDPMLPQGAYEWAPVIGGCGDRHHLRRAVLPRPDRHEAVDRVLSVAHMGFVMLGISTHSNRASTPPCSAWSPTALITGCCFFLAGRDAPLPHARDQRLSGC